MDDKRMIRENIYYSCLIGFFLFSLIFPFVMMKESFWLLGVGSIWAGMFSFLGYSGLRNREVKEFCFYFSFVCITICLLSIGGFVIK